MFNFIFDKFLSLWWTNLNRCCYQEKRSQPPVLLGPEPVEVSSRTGQCFINPLTPTQGHWWPLSPKFQFNFEKGSSKNYLWASHLWVGRRKEPILGYVPKNYEKKNSVLKGLIFSSLYSSIGDISWQDKSHWILSLGVL